MNITSADLSAGLSMGGWKLFQFLRALILFTIFRLLARAPNEGSKTMLWDKITLWIFAIILAACLGVEYGDPNNSHSSDEDDEYGGLDNAPEVHVTQQYIHQNTVAIFITVLGVSAAGIIAGYASKEDAEKPRGLFDQSNYGRYSAIIFALCLCLFGCSHTVYIGQVSQVRQLRGGMVIDLDGRYPNQAMTIYVPNADMGSVAWKIPSVGQTISVRGSITSYHGRPEIVVTSANQLN